MWIHLSQTAVTVLNAMQESLPSDPEELKLWEESDPAVELTTELQGAIASGHSSRSEFERLAMAWALHLSRRDHSDPDNPHIAMFHESSSAPQEALAGVHGIATGNPHMAASAASHLILIAKKGSGMFFLALTCLEKALRKKKPDTHDPRMN